MIVSVCSGICVNFLFEKDFAYASGIFIDCYFKEYFYFALIVHFASKRNGIVLKLKFAKALE